MYIYIFAKTKNTAYRDDNVQYPVYTFITLSPYERIFPSFKDVCIYLNIWIKKFAEKCAL